MLKSPRQKPATIVMSLILIMGTLGLGGTTVVSAVVADEPPEVRILSPRALEVLSEQQVTFEWAGSDPEGQPLTYTARYSADGGATWLTLITGTASTALVVPRSRLAASPSARFEVSVSDGVSTRQVVVSPFFVTNNRPRVVIEQPPDRSAFLPGEIIEFSGRAADTEDGILDGGSLRWSSDRAGELGSGSSTEVPVSNLDQGLHIVTLSAEDSSGSTTNASVTILVTEPDTTPPSVTTTTPTTIPITTLPPTTPATTASSTTTSSTTTSSVVFETTTETTTETTIETTAPTIATTSTSATTVPSQDLKTLRVRAKGDTGEEMAEVQVMEEATASFAVTTEWQDFVYLLPAGTSLEDIRVTFVNDAVQPTLSGRLRDRNLSVDHIEFDGIVHESEAQTTRTHGTWSRRNGCGPGNKQSEVLHCNGHFQYASSTPLPVPDPPKSPTSLVVRVKGDTGEEYGEVRVAGAVYATFAASTDWTDYAYELPPATVLADIEVAFINDAVQQTLSGRDRDRNLRVDYIDFGGVRHESELETTLSTGAWSRSNGCGPGNKRTQVLHCNGGFRYVSD